MKLDLNYLKIFGEKREKSRSSINQDSFRVYAFGCALIYELRSFRTQGNALSVPAIDNTHTHTLDNEYVFGLFASIAVQLKSHFGS